MARELSPDRQIRAIGAAAKAAFVPVADRTCNIRRTKVSRSDVPHRENVPAADLLSQWLLHRRDGGDPHLRRKVSALLDRYIDRLLDGARLASGETLVDVGSGEGLIAFRAIERADTAPRVCLTDVSRRMLRHAEARAIEHGARGKCTLAQRKSRTATD